MIVLCTGGESCGTRLMTRLVAQMDAGSIHRSRPHGRTWEDLEALGWDKAVVMTRDWWAAAQSQVKARHVADTEQAFANLERAYADLTTFTRPWRLVSYESLVARPGPVLRNLAEWLELDASLVTEAIRDENEKWIGEADA